ncbi:MAG: heme-copper oxidase subunit III [Candidatus Hodarchaeota archaeon]
MAEVHLLHPIVVHFHIALFAFSVFATVVAFVLSFLVKSSFFRERILKGLLKELISEKSITGSIVQFEIASFLAIIMGFLGILVAMFAGFMDASGLGIEGLLEGRIIEGLLLGMKAASEGVSLSYKVTYSIFGAYCFILAGVMRLYYMNYRKESIFDQVFLIQLVFVGTQILGYLVLTLVAGTGAQIAYGETAIELIPIISDFLPGRSGNLLILILAAAGLGILAVFISQFGKIPSEESPPETPPEEELEEETTLWPPALALGTGVLGFAIILFVQGDFLSGFSLFVLFIAGILSYAYKEVSKLQIQRTDHMWIWIFLASEIMFFSILIGLSFALRLTSVPAFYPFCGDNASPPWPDKSAILNIPLTAVNTFVLILSSFTMVKAVEAISYYGNVKRLRNYLLMTFGLGATFLSIQGYEYLSFFHEGFTPSSGLLGATFFLQTGFHGAHVFIGILLVLFIAVKSARGGYSKKNFSGVEQVGLYWHFVDLVWIVLFTLVYLL